MNVAAEVIQQCKANKPAAQAMLYDCYARLVMGICARYCSKMDAEDMFQETFIKVYQNISQYSGEGSIEGWIRRIAVNTCLSHLKKTKIVMDISDVAETEMILQDCETAVEQMSAATLVALIDELPLGCKTVFNLYAVEGFSHKEIGEMLNLSEGTSKSQLHHAKGLLKKMLLKKEISRYE